MSLIFFYILFFSSLIQAMETDKSDVEKLNKNQSDNSLADKSKNHTLQLMDLPGEIITQIAHSLFLLNYDGNILKLINEFRRFAWIIIRVSRGRLDVIGSGLSQEKYINFLSIHLKMNPFFIVRIINKQLAPELKEKYKKLAINDVLSKRQITYEQLNSWLDNQTKNQDELYRIFFSFNREQELKFIIPVLALLHSGFEPDLTYHYVQREYTALIYASFLGCEEIVEILLNVGADPNLKNRHSDTALCRASLTNDNVKIVRMLLKAGANLDTSCYNQHTPLMIAAIHGCEKIVTLLLESGMDPNSQNKKGNTALILASSDEKNKEIVRLLLDAKVKIDTQNDHGNTALIKAAASSCSEILTMLLVAGANPNLKNNEGYSALNYAKKYKNKQTINLLKSFGAKSPKCISS